MGAREQFEPSARAPVTEGNRLRLSIIGVVVLSLFAALFARLWYLQSTAKEGLVSVAQANQVRYVEEPAWRGKIVDRRGRVLAENKVVDAVTVDRNLVGKKRQEVVGSLGEILGIPADEINQKIDDKRISPYRPVTVATDVPIETITYLAEHRADFPGVDATRLPVRVYPNGYEMAHVLGYTGEINDDELKANADAGYTLGDPIGKAGVEQSSEADLRGTPRRVRVEVDSRGRVVRTTVDREQEGGHDVVLTLDSEVQKVTEDALAQGLDRAHSQADRTSGSHPYTFRAPAGTVIVLDARDGSVVAMASNPTYDPNNFVNGIPTETWNELNDPGNFYPLVNRAVQGQYAPGSTFKLITSLAGLEAGLITPATTMMDNGKLKVADRFFENAGGEAHGPVNLANALRVSSDVYFYQIGYDAYLRGFDREKVLYSNPDAGDVIQQTARKYGFGNGTGIALPSEQSGRVPDSAWKKAVHAENSQAFPYELWLPGDNVNFSAGQGDVLATPLQLAEAYATFANGGTRYVPRVVDRILDDPQTGVEATTVRQETSKVAGTTNLDPANRQAILDGLSQVASAGTAKAAFGGWPFETYSIAAKTGTAQVNGKQDTSIFVAMTPADNPQYVVLTVVEEGGFGASVAAPIVRHVMEYLVGLSLTPVGYVAPDTKAD